MVRGLVLLVALFNFGCEPATSTQQGWHCWDASIMGGKVPMCARSCPPGESCRQQEHAACFFTIDKMNDDVSSMCFEDFRTCDIVRNVAVSEEGAMMKIEPCKRRN